MSAAVVEVKQSPFERAIAKFGAYFEERGLTPADIPAAIVVHELIGLVIAAGAWTVRFKSQTKIVFLIFCQNLRPRLLQQEILLKCNKL